jgi:hypothetical protein
VRRLLRADASRFVSRVGDEDPVRCGKPERPVHLIGGSAFGHGPGARLAVSHTFGFSGRNTDVILRAAS